MTNLNKLRDSIDELDEKIVELFEKRMEVVVEVAKYKSENNIPVLNSSREEEVIEKNIKHLKNKGLQKYLKEFYISLMDLSKDYQDYEINKKNSNINVCFQGTIGSYSEEALFKYFGRDVSSCHVEEFEDVFKKLKDEKIDYGVLPIENSSTGAITEVYDLLRKYGLYIVGNISLKINHNLMAVEEANIGDIKKIYSHPQAFKQCSEFLKTNKDWEMIPYHNTAVSAELVKHENTKDIAAIGSKKAAEVNGLNILKENINNNNTNYTRFIIIGKKLEKNRTNDAISMVFSSADKVGSLYDNLSIFKENNLNMIRIESRPIIGTPWEYFFYIDFEGNIKTQEVRDAIDYIRKNSSYFKLLGSYKKN